MLIQRIKISNFKTYLSLDLDLTVDDDRPIILIGGSNGGGKTTLFEAISGALYGLKIESKEHFMELLNQGAVNKVKPEISLQITFVGKVLGQQQKGQATAKALLNQRGYEYIGISPCIVERQNLLSAWREVMHENAPDELAKILKNELSKE